MSATPGRMVFERVWKKFHRGNVHDSLRDLIPSTIGRMLRRQPAPVELDKDDFWAVKDLSFEVNPGECLGIIGPNGSGKSTTLKLLTRIYAPTRGRCATEGRLGTLIEVSAGFHGDLTGRENVFLQGAIMGMRMREVRRKFDEIVAFSGVEEFIDTPVKRYSSGMNARLGFSIAAHLEPDVLVIDEVLSVGDLQFQARAFGRIREMTRSGIPVIMVSHQLERVAELCSHVLVLKKGEVTAQGEASEAIAQYVQQQGAEAAANSSGPVTFQRVSLHSNEPVPSGQTFGARVEGTLHQAPGVSFEPLLVRVRSLRTGNLVYACTSSDIGVTLGQTGPFAFDVTLQANIPPGVYLVEFLSADLLTQRELSVAPPLMFRVAEAGAFRGSVQMNAAMARVTT